MLYSVGWVKEKWGKPVNKTMWCSPLDSEKRKWKIVKQTYHGDKELEFKVGKDRKFPLKIREWLYQRGSVLVSFRDWETGDALNFSGKSLMGFRPEEYDTVSTAKDVKLALTSSNGMDMVTMIALGIAGLVGGMFIMIVAYPYVFPNNVVEGVKAALMLFV